MANKETRIYKTDTLESLRQKSNEISLHLGDNEQLNALMADKTYVYSAGAGHTLFAGPDTSSPAKTARFEVSPAHTVDNTGGYIILEGVSSIASSYVAGATIYQGSNGSPSWSGIIVSSSTSKILVRDSSGTFTTSADLKVGASSPDTIAHAKVIRIVTEAYPIGIVRVYKNNSELTQDMNANGFHVANIRATITQTGSPTLTNYTEGVTIYQGDSQATQALVEANATWYGTLHSVSGGVIRVKTYNGSFNAGTLIRALGSTDTITGANHGALVPVDSTYGSYIELNTPAASGNAIKIFSLDVVAAINELQDDIGTVESLTTAANDLVLAINEHDAELGTITAGAMGTSASTVSTAIREHEDQIGNVDITDIDASNDTITGALDQLHDEVGDVTQSNLGTAASNLTSAVREHEDQIGNENITSIDSGSNTITGALNQLHTEVGSLSLNTSATDLTAAINEHESDIGNMTLTGLSASDLSAAVRELRSELGNHLEIDDATGYSASTAVGGIKEIQGDVGNVDSLDTNTTADLVAAINELENVLRDDTTQRTGYVMGTNANNIIAAINEIETVLRGANTNYTLNTSAQNVRDAINEHEQQIGNMAFGTGGPVDAADSTNLSAAIRVLDAEIGDTSYIDADITTAIHNIQDDINVNGSLTTLNTTNTSVVDAINEIEADLFNSGNAGSGGSRREMSDLKTADKTSILDAMNEIYDDIHTSGSVTLGTDASHLVGAINEIEGVFDASTYEISAGSNAFTVTSGSLTLDTDGDITLDAAGSQVFFKQNGTQFAEFQNVNSGNLKISSGSSTMLTGNGANATFANNLTVTNDLIVDNNVDIDGNVDVNGSIETDGLSINGITLTATATELNVMDGGTSATSTTLADADRLVVNDNGVMKQVGLQNFETYFESALDTLPNVTTVGALNAGSITSGFGNINIGSSTITTSGSISGGAITGTSFTIGSAAINETELERIDGLTIGTVTASKVVTVNANKDVTGFRNITLTGELDAGSLDISGNVDIDGTLDVALGSTLRSTVNIQGITTISNATESSVSSATDGALIVTGGASIGKNLYVGGNLQVEGTQTILNTETLTVEDTLVLAGNSLSSEPSTGGFGLEVGPITSPSGVASNVTGAHSIVYNYGHNNGDGTYGRWEADGSLILSSATLATPQVEGVDFGPNDNLTFSAGAGLSETVTKTGATIVTNYINTDRGSSQYIWKTITADSGSVAANSNTDSLAFTTGDDLTTSISGDGVVINHDALGTAGTYGQTSTQDGKYIKSIITNAQGHVTGVTSADFDTRYQATNPSFEIKVNNTKVDDVFPAHAIDLIEGIGIDIAGALSGSESNITISHQNTSSVGNLSQDNNGNTFIQDLAFTFDTFGHVTGATASTGSVTTVSNADNVNVDEKNDNVNYQVLFSANNGTGYQRPYIDSDNAHLLYNPSAHTLTAGTFNGNLAWNNLTGKPTLDNYVSWQLYVNGTSQDAITSGERVGFDEGPGIDLSWDGNDLTISHQDTSSVTNLSSNNSNGVVLQDISFTFDTFGHTTARSIGTVDLDNRYERLVNIPSYDGDDIDLDTSGAQVIDHLEVTTNTLGHVTHAYANTRNLTLGDLNWSAWAISDGTNSETVGGTGQTIIFNDDSFLTQTYNTTNNQMTVGHPTSPLNGTYGGNNNGIVIEDITVDTRGHLTSIGTRDLNNLFDKYYDWNVDADTGGSKSIQSNYTLDIEGGTNISTATSGSGSALKVTVGFDDPGYLLTSNEKTATLDVQGNGSNPYVRLNDGSSDHVRIIGTGTVTSTGSESADTITIHGIDTNTDINVNDANLRSRLAGLHKDNGGVVYIGDSGNDLDLRIRGNLRVEGTQTIMNTETVTTHDNKIELNSNAASTPTEDAGLIVNRGSSTNAQIYWSEANDRWYHTYGDGGTAHPILIPSEVMSGFTIQDGDADQRSIASGKHIKFQEGTTSVVRSGNDYININWTDTSTGSSSVPYDLDIAHKLTTRSDPATGTATLSASGNFSAVTGVTTNATGHLTAVNTTQFTLPASAVPNDATITISGGTAINTNGGSFTTDQNFNETITLNHSNVSRSDTTSTDSPNAHNDTFTAVDSVSTNAQGHITAVNLKTIRFPASDNTNDFSLTTFQVEDGDGNEVTISHGKEWKFVEGNDIDIDWTDNTPGSNADPFDLTFAHKNTTRTNTTSTAAPGYGGTFTAIDSVSSNARGHVTGINTKTITIPASDNTDEKYTFDCVQNGGSNNDPYLKVDGSTESPQYVLLNGGSNVTVTRNNDAELTIAADNDNTFLNDVTTIDNGADMILRHTMSTGSSHDVGITAGTNITVTPGTRTFEIATTGQPNQNAYATFKTFNSGTTSVTHNAANTGDDFGLNFRNGISTSLYGASGSGMSIVDVDSDQSGNISVIGPSGSDDCNLGMEDGGGDVEDNKIHFRVGGTALSNRKFTLDGTGKALFKNDVVAFSTSVSSDKKLKTNIVRVENALDKVCQLEGVTFDWKKDGKESAGVIAQNVEDVLPSAVKEVPEVDSDDTHKNVDYNQLSALFIEAIKELKEENKLLRAEIESLKDINS